MKGCQKIRNQDIVQKRHWLYIFVAAPGPGLVLAWSAETDRRYREAARL